MESTSIIKREEFGAAQTTAALETAASAIAARERGETEARYVMAERHPRDIESVRVAILKECERPGFADVARYKKPIGGTTIEGPSIRFAEAALRCYGNIYAPQAIVFEDEQQRIIRVAVTDLENNISYPSEIVVKKTVERKQKREGLEVLGERKNMKGETVYLIRATEDDIQNKQNALVSKALRNNGLRLIPGDIIEECMERVLQTQRKADKQDPDAAKRKVIDAFAGLGIGPAELAVFLGHSLERIQPAELVELRAAYSAIRDGEAYWSDLLAAKGIADAKSMQQAVAAEKIASATATPAPESQRPSRTCKICGEAGHDSRNCPTKAARPVVREFDEFPDPLEINDERIYHKGIVYQRNEDNTGWRKVEKE